MNCFSATPSRSQDVLKWDAFLQNHPSSQGSLQEAGALSSWLLSLFPLSLVEVGNMETELLASWHFGRAASFVTFVRRAVCSAMASERNQKPAIFHNYQNPNLLWSSIICLIKPKFLCLTSRAPQNAVLCIMSIMSLEGPQTKSGPSCDIFSFASKVLVGAISLPSSLSLHIHWPVLFRLDHHLFNPKLIY